MNQGFHQTEIRKLRKKGAGGLFNLVNVEKYMNDSEYMLKYERENRGDVDDSKFSFQYDGKIVSSKKIRAHPGLGVRGASENNIDSVVRDFADRNANGGWELVFYLPVMFVPDRGVALHPGVRIGHLSM